MFINKVVPAKAEGETNAPYPYCGKLVCTEETEQDRNLFARFIEDCWLRQGGEDFAVSFVPTEKEAILWVSAKTEQRLEDFMKWTIDLLVKGLEQQGVKCILVEK